MPGIRFVCVVTNRDCLMVRTILGIKVIRGKGSLDEEGNGGYYRDRTKRLILVRVRVMLSAREKESCAFGMLVDGIGDR